MDRQPHGRGTPQHGPLGSRETSGVNVVLGTRGVRPQRRRSPAGLVGLAALAVVAVLVVGVLLWLPGSDGETGGAQARGVNGGSPGTADLPRHGAAVDVDTADGSRYRVAAVAGGSSDGTAVPQQSTPPEGTTFPYIDYVLTNPSDAKVLLDFPGDVFVKREMVAEGARGRCMWQAGVPDDMCTPPVTSRVVRSLSGGALLPGEGDDQYLPPGASYLVRATVEVPVDAAVTQKDLRLYVWRQLFVADRLARRAPFPG